MVKNYENRADLVFIKYKKQVAYYLSHNVKPIDVTLDEKDTLVFIYSKDNTKDLYYKFKAENKVDSIEDNVHSDSGSMRMIK